MDKVMEFIFVSAGHTISFMGGFLAIALIGLAPLYLYGYGYYKGISVVNSSPKLLFSIALILSLLCSSVFAISAIVMGRWG